MVYIYIIHIYKKETYRSAKQAPLMCVCVFVCSACGLKLLVHAALSYREIEREGGIRYQQSRGR
jgi:hypothetical protein